MARLTKQTEMEIEAGRGWDAVSSALQLSELITELRFKNDWEPAALFGDKQMGKLKQGGGHNKKYEPEVVAQTVLDLMDPENPDSARSKTEAVGMAACKLKVAASTIYRKLKEVEESTLAASDRSK